VYNVIDLNTCNTHGRRSNSFSGGAFFDGRQSLLRHFCTNLANKKSKICYSKYSYDLYIHRYTSM